MPGKKQCSSYTMHATFKFFLFHFLIWSVSSSRPLEGLNEVLSVKALTAIMYRDMRGWGGAYKLLNATRTIGSQGPDDPLEWLDAPLVHYSDLDKASNRHVAVLLPVKQSSDFFEGWLNGTWSQNVQAVLVDDSDPPSTYSTLGAFPGAEYAPYAEREYIWNPASGQKALVLAATSFPAPVFLLTPEMASDAQQRAAYNSKSAANGQQYHARIKLTMTAHASPNSTACIAAGVCKPVGGFSVWSAVPPLTVTASSPAVSLDQQPIIVITAQMDSMEMFHDNTQGANAPLSGLLALLAVQHMFNATAAAGRYNKRIVFLALAGEPWGYLGSRRLLWEASSSSNATQGFDLRLIEKVIEVGQVGALRPLSADGDTLALYAHTSRGSGDATEVLTALSAAAQSVAAASQISVEEASSSNPGLPPSSLMSFLRVNASIQGVVLAEFDKAMHNPFYASRFDNGSQISARSIAGTAAVLAAAVHRMAGGVPQQLQVNMTELQDVVSQYIACLIMPEPGFSCALASSMMTADYVYSRKDGSRSYAPNNYVGVLQFMPEIQAPLAKNNLARFLWNLMALNTATSPPGSACDPYGKPCEAGQVCAGWRGSDEQSMGRCVVATVRYVPAYSTKIACQSCDDPWQIKWQVSDSAEAWNQQYDWPPDPMWTESDWPTIVPDLQLYLHESAVAENSVLAAGFVVTAVFGVASYFARVAFAKHHLAWSQI